MDARKASRRPGTDGIRAALFLLGIVALPFSMAAGEGPPGAPSPSLPGASPPQWMSFQGDLRDGSSKPLTGTYDMVFRLYDAPMGGTFLLSDAHNAAQGGPVAVTEGLFETVLGGGQINPGSQPSLGAAFANVAAVWLEIQIGAETLGPRLLMTSAGYAQNARTLEGKESTAFAGAAHQHAGSDITGPVAEATAASRAGDSDTLDGQHSADFSPLIHTQDASTITGTLVASQGGTGLASSGATGNILTSTGTGWMSAPPSAIEEVDGVVGNEVLGAANPTLSRSGAGTTADPYALAVNLNNANTWLGQQTFGSAQVTGTFKDTSGAAGTSGQVLQSTGTGTAWTAFSGLEGDSVIGNEIADAANATLTRSGAGTLASPYELALNLNSANTWAAQQTFSSAQVTGTFKDGSGTAGATGQVLQSTGTGIDWTGLSALEGDGVVGNEIADAANVTLTRSGSGTVASPYELAVNLNSANTWVAQQTFGSAQVTGALKDASGAGGSTGQVLQSTGTGTAWTAFSGLEGDAVVGNEVRDAANATLSRSGAGTSGDPYKLALNLGNANTWVAQQTFGSAQVTGTFKDASAAAGSTGQVLQSTGTATAWTALSGLEGDGVVGNEVRDAANATLSRSGAGTSGDPYKLALNLGNANTWVAQQTFGSAQVAGILKDGAGASGGTGQVLQSTGTGTSWTLLSSIEGDGIVGNEIREAANPTLTRSGAGTSGDPYRIALNLNNSNAWSGTQTFDSAEFAGMVRDGAGAAGSSGEVLQSTGMETAWTALSTLEGDAVVGNEVKEAANSTLTRSGAGTGGDPYKLALNLNNVNTWSGTQTFGSAQVNGMFRDYLGSAGSLGQVLQSTGTQAAWTSLSTLEGDAVVGNEVLDAANSTLTRSGAGTSGDPCKLALNLGNVNSWSGAQTFSANTNFPNLGVWNNAGQVGIGRPPAGFLLHLAADSAAKPMTNTWTIFSDRRLKKNIRPFTDGLEVLKGIDPIRYQYNGLAGLPKDAECIGVVAQEIQKVAPYTVSTHRAKLDERDEAETELYDFNSHALTFVLINAVKELDARIRRLESAQPSALETETSADSLALADAAGVLQAPASLDSEAPTTPAPTGTSPERHPVCEPVEKGAVLADEADHPGTLCLARMASDPSVVGIAADSTGSIDFGKVETEPRVALASTGIVSCKVDAGYGPIARHDLLVASPTPGHAMKAVNPAPGTVLGKALEPLAAGVGVIQILVMLR